MIGWEERAPSAHVTSKKMIGGKPPKSTSKEASTAVHVLVYKLMQSTQKRHAAEELSI